MTKKATHTTSDIILTALFATLTVIGTTIRIPMPAAVGTPFIHLGNAVLLLAVLLIGYKKGALAGGLGFAIFDVLNGFAAEAPYFILESFVVGGVATLIFRAFQYRADRYYKLLLTSIGAGLAKIGMTFGKNTVVALLLGTDFKPAITASFLSLPATFINFVSTIILVSLTYYPLKQIISKFYQRSSKRFS